MGAPGQGAARVLVVGGGKMGEAIVAGWLSSDEPPAASLRPADVVVVEPGQQRRQQLEGAYGVACVAGVAAAPAANMVVLAVKPQVMSSVLAEIREAGALAGPGTPPLFVSIAAGVTTSTLEAGLPSCAAVVRVMPNMALMVGAGASGVCAGVCASAEQLRYVAELFGCLGRAVVVDEASMDAVCALSGSGPAYVCALVEAMRDGAAACGFDAQLAEQLAVQTVLGTAQLIAQTGRAPADVRASICSPGGTTLAALDAMEQAGFSEAVKRGVEAAVARSKELAAC